MSLWVDHKYMGLLSSHLQLFKRKTKDLYNFRCPVCGDSQKNKFKARGYLMAKRDKLVFYCHNCGASKSMYDFVQHLDPELHKQYVMETYEEKNSSKKKKIDFKPDISRFTKPKYMTNSELKNLKKISQLQPDHKAKVYVDGRKIPTKYHAKLFYCPNFFGWINTIVKNKFDDKALALDGPRLVIPFIDEEQNVIGVQGRALDQSNLRYITIMFDEAKPKIFGLDTVDLNKKMYILEGPIDSMFVDNSIAMAGSDGDLSRFDACRTVFVYDNEPRNKDIVNKVEKQLRNDSSVFIWPDNVVHKDINDCVLAGMSAKQIMDMIESNTYKSLKGRLRLNDWKRV